ncbi:MAG TPA: hypothetical protein VHE30_25245 [Polyangiaceae bacterium]|nr:hypothetical protein [Polyangiaceae bacterium]
MRGFGKLLSATVIGLVALSPRVSLAAESEASPTGKGITGGALLGAEAVMLVEAAASTKPAWAYAVGGGLGAVAGGVGGYFAENGGDAKLSIYLLVGGMALALPTTVAVLSASAYEPTNYTEDHPPADEPVAEPARPESAPAAPAPAPAPAAAPQGSLHRTRPAIAKVPALPPALVGVSGDALTLSLPAVEVRQMYTRTEVAVLGVKQQTEVEVPVLNVVF